MLPALQVVQCLTELGLSVRHARISSDGGWFVDGEQHLYCVCILLVLIYAQLQMVRSCWCSH